MPNNTNDSVEADVVRIRLFHNEHFGHIPNTSVSSADFMTLDRNKFTISSLRNRQDGNRQARK